jgi:hypothetical protein
MFLQSRIRGLRNRLGVSAVNSGRGAEQDVEEPGNGGVLVRELWRYGLGPWMGVGLGGWTLGGPWRFVVTA